MECLIQPMATCWCSIWVEYLCTFFAILLVRDISLYLVGGLRPFLVRLE